MNLHRIHNDMLGDGISFCFTGFMSEDTLLGIGNTLKQKFEIDSIDKTTSMSMFSVFVEMVQNVIRYSAENQVDDKEPAVIDLRYGILSIGQKDGQNFIAKVSHLPCWFFVCPPLTMFHFYIHPVGFVLFSPLGKRRHQVKNIERTDLDRTK